MNRNLVDHISDPNWQRFALKEAVKKLVLLTVLFLSLGVHATSVTLKDIDGGASYFAKWSNSFPVDPKFFPLGVWAETLEAGHTADKYKALGINVFVNSVPLAPEQMAQVQAQGLYAIGGVEGQEANLAAHFLGDEADMFPLNVETLPSWLAPHCHNGSSLFRAGFTHPSSVKEMSDLVRAHDPTRPVYAQYSRSVATGTFSITDLSVPDKRIYAQAGDILSFDHYVISDPLFPAPVWGIYDATRAARENSGFSRPVWTFIELSRIFPEGHASVTPAQVGAEVWNAIIAGARGIEYFNHNFFCQVIEGDAAAQGCTSHLLTDPAYAVMASTVLSLNSRIRDLAPILNAPFVDGYLRTTDDPSISYMVKFWNDHYYIFAIPHASGNREIEFLVNDNSAVRVTVLDEHRELKVENGIFRDSFANENQVHIYRIDP